ncbi:hypothetical protein [Geopseudomonas aromaticivorans]
MAGNEGDTKRRQIARLNIRDVLAIEAMELDVDGSGLSIRGRTGSGKTSILDALSAAFGRSARSEMLRQGTDHGEIMVVLNDGSQITREVTHKGLSSPKVNGPDGKPVKRPAEYLNQLVPGLSLNPVEFVTSSDAVQFKMLADAFPVKVTLDELATVAGPSVDLSELAPKESELNGLELAMAAAKIARAKLTEKSTLYKRAESQRQALVGQIPVGFNPDEIRGVSTADLANELASVGQHNRVVAETEGKLNQTSTAISRGEGQIETTKAEIARLQKQLEAQEQQLATVKANRAEIESWLKSNPRVETTSLELRLQSLDEQRVVLGNYDRSRELEAEAKTLMAEGTALKGAKQRLEAFPAELTRRVNIPIEGLSIEDGRILINGLPVSNLSDGERLRLAIQIAAAGAGELGFVCVDGAERLSEDVREELLSGLEQKGIQFFLTEVDNADLTVSLRHTAEAPANQVEQVVEAAVAEATAQPAPVVDSAAAEEVPAVEQEAPAAAEKRIAPAAASWQAEVPEVKTGALTSVNRQEALAASAELESAFPVRSAGENSPEVLAAYQRRVEAEELAMLDDDVPEFGVEADEPVVEPVAEVKKDEPAMAVAEIPAFEF